MAGLNRTQRTAMEEIRVRVVTQVLSGVAVPEIVAALGVSKQSVYSWVRKYNAGGMEALSSTKARGAKAKLDRRQMAKLTKLVVGSDPRQLRFELGAALQE